VIRLRQHEAAHEEAVRISRENVLLKELLIANNIPLPSNLSSRLGSPMSVSVFDRPDGSQDLRATISPDLGSPTTLLSGYASERSPDKQGSPASYVPEVGTLPIEPRSTTYQCAPSDVNSVLLNPTASWVQSQPHEMDRSQIALDFVLGCVCPRVLQQQQIIFKFFKFC
jgi:hypothetical protein